MPVSEEQRDLRIGARRRYKPWVSNVIRCEKHNDADGQKHCAKERNTDQRWRCAVSCPDNHRCQDQKREKNADPKKSRRIEVFDDLSQPNFEANSRRRRRRRFTRLKRVTHPNSPHPSPVYRRSDRTHRAASNGHRCRDSPDPARSRSGPIRRGGFLRPRLPARSPARPGR